MIKEVGLATTLEECLNLIETSDISEDQTFIAMDRLGLKIKS